MVNSLFKGSKVEPNIESALLNHEFDTEKYNYALVGPSRNHGRGGERSSEVPAPD